MYALSIDNVSFSYANDVATLREISFQVHTGEFLSILGPNGSGKTTLLRLLDRILLPHAGTITLGQRNLALFTRSELAKQIAFVPQDSGTQFPFTVMEIVLMGRAPHTRGAMFESARDRAIALEMLETTDAAHLANHPITNLSGGERQRVFIARALAQQPNVLLLDEPNAHLDIAHQLEIFDLIKRLNVQTGLTVVSVSHDLNLAAAYSDRVALLVCGKLVALGTPDDVLTEQNIFDAFRAKVIVDRHPSIQAPRVSLMTLQ
ncbi:MAG: ABC transporter ATP-binding protein [Ignavibacteriae bacterium]|nr:ABC transporter ATP-binding protein [Ignavibacteriota bacterium]